MSSPPLSSWRVLIVDDEPDSIETVKMVLSASGAIVYEAYDGMQGFEVFQRERPNIVLSDLSMPKLDGWALLKKIRASENNSHKTTVIALTAHAMIGDKKQVMEAGFNGYLSKPLTMFTLIQDLSQYIDL